jgi:hypothetical protein
VMAPSVE